MIVLAVDTASEFGSLALGYGSEIVEEAALHAPDGFSAVLFQEIGELLKRNTLRLEEVDIYAAASGPGSFTGVRIGLTAVKSLAAVNGKPCYGVSNLRAMAQFGTAACRAVLLDARRGEIYGAVYGLPSRDEVVTRVDRWVGDLPKEIGEFLAFDFGPFDEAIAGSEYAGVARTSVGRSIASAIAEIALDNFRAGVVGDAALLDANYVRRSDAELLWKEG